MIEVKSPAEVSIFEAHKTLHPQDLAEEGAITGVSSEAL